MNLGFCTYLFAIVQWVSGLNYKGGILKLHTTPQSGFPYYYTKLSRYGYEVGTSTCIEFYFKGCKDAFVALMQEDDDTDSKSMYEILIGGWYNTQSVIRLSKNSPDLKAKKVLSGVVNCNELRKFKIGWKDGYITVYRWVKPCKWEILMSWHSTLYAVNYIGVTTAELEKGDWMIANKGCPEPIIRNTLWENDNKRKDIVFSASIFTRRDIISSLQCAVQCQRYSYCCYYTYNRKQLDCRGFSDTAGPSTTSVGTKLWIRY